MNAITIVLAFVVVAFQRAWIVPSIHFGQLTGLVRSMYGLHTGNQHRPLRAMSISMPSHGLHKPRYSIKTFQMTDCSCKPLHWVVIVHQAAADGRQVRVALELAILHLCRNAFYLGFLTNDSRVLV